MSIADAITTNSVETITEFGHNEYSIVNVAECSKTGTEAR